MNHSIQGKYYGTPVTVRIEDRATGPAVIYSFQTDGRILYEHPPRRLNADMEKLWDHGRGYQALQEACSHLENLADKQMREFFHQMLDLTGGKNSSPQAMVASRAENIRRRVSLTDLTLGAMIAADYDTLLLDNKGQERCHTTVLDDKRILKELLNEAGCAVWREVTPKRYGNWLGSLPRYRRKAIKRLMLKLLIPLNGIGAVGDLLEWDHYKPQGAESHRKSHRSSVRENIESRMLTYGQCKALFPPYDENGRLNVSPLDVAIVLKTTLGLDDKELCALRFKNFTTLPNYPDRLVVRITHQCVRLPEHKNYQIIPIEDACRRRVLPLSRYAALCVEALRKNAAEKAYLIPSPTNKYRHTSPPALEKKITHRLKPLWEKASARPPQSFRMLLERTAENELRKASAEDDELRFIKGAHEITVAAAHYADYSNEAVLNRLGATQDRWLKKVLEAPPETRPQKSGSGQSFFWKTPHPGTRTQLYLEVPIPADQHAAGDLIFDLYAVHGYSGEIAFEPNNTNEKENTQHEQEK